MQRKLSQLNQFLKLLDRKEKTLMKDSKLRYNKKLSKVNQNIKQIWLTRII
jgi:hypothetical protein